jgi:DNA-binding transcriptional LysR family regulator
MDRLDAMHIVVAVGEGGSLSAAARRLGMPLPTVSRKIADLEAHLNTRLFNRSTRRLTPTDSGLEYLRACKQIIEDVAEAERCASGEFNTPKGALVISAPIVFGRLHVLPIIIAFLGTYPDVHVRLAQSDRLVSFLEDHIDLAVRIGELSDSQLITTRCGSTRRVLCGSPSYFATHGAPKRAMDLSNHTLIVVERLASADSWTFIDDSSEVDVPIRPRLIVNTAEAAIDAALTGFGITRVFSYQVEQALQSGALVSVLKRCDSDAVPISLVYPSQRRLPLKVRAFLDFAAPRLRARMVSARPTLR